MVELAEVVRLEEHLTVPTRDRAPLVDLWISLGWKARLADWASEFEAVVASHNAAASAEGTLQLVPMSESQGWIAARGVDLDRVAPSDVESFVRRLVMQVNARMEALVPASTTAPSATTWPGRLRSSISGGSLLGSLLPTPRRRRDADVPSTA